MATKEEITKRENTIFALTQDGFFYRPIGKAFSLSTRYLLPYT